MSRSYGSTASERAVNGGKRKLPPLPPKKGDKGSLNKSVYKKRESYSANLISLNHMYLLSIYPFRF